MNSINKLLLSAHLIKKAFTAGNSVITGMPINNYAPKAPPAPVAKPVTPVKRAPVAAVSKPKPSTSSFSAYKPILDVIRRGEANVAGYDTMVGSNKPFGLTKKTLQQVLDIQAQRLKDYGGTAAGGYQILQKNLKDLAAKHKHDLNKTLFDQATQDTYARSLIDRRGFQDYLKGKINADQMRINLAKEWAALPAKGELSYYQGKGTNKARIPSKEINEAISKALQLHRQAVKP